MAVALMLDRAGFDEDVVIAGLLHDIVEDTTATFDDVAARFGPAVAETVRHCSEVKLDAQGNKRPWIDRKRDHLAALAVHRWPPGGSCWPTSCTTSSRSSWTCSKDVPSGRSFTPTGSRSSGTTEATIDACGREDLRLARLVASCEEVLARVESLPTDPA